MRRCGCYRPRCNPRGRPRPLKIEAAEAAIDVQDFSDQEQPGTASGFQTPGVDFLERDTTGRDLGEAVAPAVADGQRRREQRMQQTAARRAAQMRDRDILETNS
jgi:hypothetical protein